MQNPAKSNRKPLSLLFVALMLLGGSLPAQDAPKSLAKPIHEKLYALLEGDFVKIKAEETKAPVLERIHRLFLSAHEYSTHYYKSKEPIDSTDNADAYRMINVGVYHFENNKAVKFALNSMFAAYQINFTELYSAAFTYKSNLQNSLIIATEKTLIVIEGRCKDFETKSHWLDFSQKVRGITANAKLVADNFCRGPVYLR